MKIDRPIEITLRWLLGIAILANSLFGVFLINRHLNILQVDLSGHIWSAIQFGRGLFHSYSDQIFLGYIHDLFYPPLEDFILSAITKGLGTNPIQGYLFYLSILLCAYLILYWRLMSCFKNWRALIIIAAPTIFLLNIDKTDMIKLQGLSLIDLFVTGLSSETLGMCFLIPMIQSDLFDDRPSKIKRTVWLSLAILSHIVVGLVAILWTVLHCINKESRKERLGILFFGLLLTAFYWLPIVANKQYMATSVIFNFAPWLAFILSIIGLGYSLKQKSSKSSVVLLMAVLLMATTTVFQATPWLQAHVPKFHYYRFTIFGYLFLALGLATFFEYSQLKIPKILVGSLATIFAIHLFTGFSFQRYNFNWRSFTQTRVDFSAIGKVGLEPYGRYLVFGSDRPSDIGVDSLLATAFENFKSTKGLFWESSKTNSLQSSILGTLLSKGVVLDYYFFANFDCNIQMCLMDQAFRYYNVKGLIGNPEYLNYIPNDKKACFRNIFSNGTQLHKFIKTGQLKVTDQVYPLYRIQPKPDREQPKQYTTDAVEPLSPKGYERFNRGNKGPYSQIMMSKFKECQTLEYSHLHTVVSDEDYPIFKEIFSQYKPEFVDQSPISERPLRFEKISNHEFKISAPTDQNKLYVVKLSPQPGLQVQDSEGRLLRFFETYPYLVVFGKGDIYLRYNRTFVMTFGNWISLSSLVVFSFFGIYLVLYAERRTRSKG